MGTDAYKLFVQDIFPLDPLRQDAFKNKYNNKSAKQGSLYENKKGDKFFIFAEADDKWILEMNGKPVRESYRNFLQAENFIKRKYQTWLVNDDIYVDYLKKFYLKSKNSKTAHAGRFYFINKGLSCRYSSKSLLGPFTMISVII